MKKSKGLIYACEIFLFISIIVFNLIYKNNYLQKASIILVGIILLSRFRLYKNNNYLNPYATRIVISCLMSFLVTIYLLGLLMGFNRSIFAFSFRYIFNIIVLEFVAIVFEELIRYIICKNADNKLPIILYTIILCILNIIIEINGYDFSNNGQLFIFITKVTLPVISRECICSYLTYNVGYTPSIIFKSVITLYSYIFPIIPDLGNYIYGVVNTFLPYMIYFFASKLIDYNSKSKNYTNKSVRRIFYIPVLVILVILVILVSGLFSHTIIAIASNSMVPEYSRGDAVIYEKVDAKDIKVGEILAYKKDGIIITHRVIFKQKNGSSYIFKTKGDANNAPDSDLVIDNQVLGKVSLKIKYIGYPTLWFNEVINGKEIN